MVEADNSGGIFEPAREPQRIYSRRRVIDVRGPAREGSSSMTDLQTTTGGLPTPGPDPDESPVSSRRAVLAGAGAFGATCLLAACGTGQGGSTQGTNPNGSDFHADPAPAGSKGADAGGGSTTGTVLAAAKDVPVGGGVIKGDYVITQPTKNSFRAFSKVCTHQGCDVNKVEGGLISCPCHGSQFSITDGGVQNGPAPRPLAETTVTVTGGNVVTA
jgi:nitrite reductase/ring-hydroxylating ferredoxin subunit